METPVEGLDLNVTPIHKGDTETEARRLYPRVLWTYFRYLVCSLTCDDIFVIFVLVLIKILTLAYHFLFFSTVIKTTTNTLKYRVFKRS